MISWRRSVPVVLVSLIAVLAAVSAFSAPVRTLVNPYTGINWATVGHHRANLHTHSTESDGNLNPACNRFHRNNGYRACPDGP